MLDGLRLQRIHPRYASFRWSFLALLGLLLASHAWAAPRTYDLSLVRAGIDGPRDIAHAGDDRLFLALRDGRIVYTENGNAPVTFLDIRDRVQPSDTIDGELGLLALAFHPNYAANGFVYVIYTDSTEDSWISRFSRMPGNPNRADPSSERRLLRVPQITPNHNVNHLRFGPDGMLYIATGDGGYQIEPRCTPQQGDNLLGKILRLDVDRNIDSPPFHAIPIDNPYRGPDDIRDEIWSMGLRNPWRLSFDRQTGDLYIGDPGHRQVEGAREEVNFEPAGSPGGRNYGWKMLEGFRCRGSSANCDDPLPPCNSSVYTPPIFHYDHGQPTRCAVVGGYVYRGTSIPSLVGTYVFGDFCGQLWATSEADGFNLLPMAPVLGGTVTFGEDAAGELYVATLAGELYRIVDGDTSEAMAGTVDFDDAALSVVEGNAALQISLTRSGGADGDVSVRVRTAGGTASPGMDFVAVDQRVVWADGEGGRKGVNLAVLDDAMVEGNESIEVVLEEAAGGLGIGALARLVVTVRDDDVPGTCTPDATTLCLNEGRFAIQIFWRTPQAREGFGTAVPITSDGGWYWFFRPGNPEAFVKVLNGCTVNGHYWVFAGGMTDVETRMTVVDTVSGQIKTYDSPQFEGFGTIRDTRAFDTCP